ncbi:long-chain fatty acid--CoA ligase [Janibacter sp. GXQ6167]|uniref:AMP-dependent synthetase/ligase n=1 Tax=Janibacter sp. GXQ6167 TaxID=3240791 RepID=UPI00352320A2
MPDRTEHREGIREYASPESVPLTEDQVLARLPWRRAAERPDHPSYSRWVEDRWQEITASQHLASVIETAKGLIASGVQAGDRVALMSDTRYEWLLIDTSIWAVGGATVPIYPSSSAAQVEWIVTNSGARLLVVETERMRDALVDADLGDVEILVLDTGAVDELRGRGFSVADHEVEERRDAVRLDQPASIIYTSGTTGRPKGCVIAHRHLASEVHGLLQHPIGQVAVDGHKTMMFLPMAHVLARSVAYAAAEGGATVGFWADFKTIVDKFDTFKPDMVLGVPRVFEKVHDGIRAKAHRSGPAVAEIFRRGERVAIEWSKAKGGSGLGHARRPGLRLRVEHAIFDRLVYRKVRAALGGNCQYAISGGGALGERLGHFFRGLGVPLYEGYGLTESCAAITVNGPGCQRIGTVGAPVPGNAVRISGSGEIELKGAVVFDEYWDHPEATAAAFDDGWFRTGDLGSLDSDGYLTITGRAKEIIVTAGGKNVSPGPMEDVLRAHPLISNAMVVGEGRPYVGALITLEPDAVAHWATEQDLNPDDLRALIRGEALRAEIQTAIDEANASVSRAEGIKRYRLLYDDFTEEGGEMTATHKLKRHVIEKSRARAIEKIYR